MSSIYTVISYTLPLYHSYDLIRSSGLPFLLHTVLDDSPASLGFNFVRRLLSKCEEGSNFNGS